MRKRFKYYIILIFIVFFIFSCVEKERNVTDRLFKKYDIKEGVYVYDVKPHFINLLIDDDTEKNAQLKEALGTLDIIKILIFRSYNERIERKDIYFNEFDEFYTNNRYDDLTIISQNFDRITIKYCKINDTKSEIIIMLSDDNSFITLSLNGGLDFNTLTTLLRFDNIKTLKALKDN